MNLIKRLLILVFFAAFSFQAVADESAYSHTPIGNYNYIQIGLVSSNEASPICAGTECYKSLNGTELTASLNFAAAPYLLISASNSAEGASGANSNLTSSVGKLLIGLIGGFGPVDAEISVSDISADILTCPNGSNVCQDVLESGVDFGAMGKLWLGDKKNFNLGVTLDRYSYSPSSANISTAIFGSWLPSRHHSLSISYKSTTDINSTPITTSGALSYAYLF